MRSRLVWVILLGLLALGIPLFLRSPLYCDVTMYDVGAWDVLHGGAYYRDIFDTNLPGMLWLHMGVRSLLGWSSEALRAVDLVVFAGSLYLLSRWMRAGGRPTTAILWFWVAAVLFYLFENVSVHCQRDGWMFLPVLVGARLRVRQIQRPLARLIPSIAEGVVWGAAVWIKPHVLIPALFVWLVSLGAMTGKGRQVARWDAFGLLLGGSLMGIAGLGWLWFSGSWASFWDIMLHWNPGYYKWDKTTWTAQVDRIFFNFAPWSLLPIVAMPVAIYVIARGVRKEQGLPILAALFLGWYLQASLAQKSTDYSQAPSVLLALALLTCCRWPVGAVMFGWCLAGSLALAALGLSPPLKERVLRSRQESPIVRTLLPRNQAFSMQRARLWPRCVSEPDNPDLLDALQNRVDSFNIPNWTDLEKTKNYLQSLHLADGDLVCWYDTTHSLYRELDIRPGIRFMHVNLALEFIGHRNDIRRELLASHQRYVVGDLEAVRRFYSFDLGNPDEPRLPADFPEDMKAVYPWNQPIVFRAGRYTVHQVTNPIEAIVFPSPFEFAPW